FALAACSSCPKTKKAVAPLSTVKLAEPLTQAPPLLPPLSAPPEACSFNTIYDATLRLHPDAPPALRVRASDVRISIPTEPRGGLWLEVKRAEIKLAAWVRAEDIAFYVTKPLVFGGWWSPNGSVPVHVHAYKSATLWIAPPEPAGVRCSTA